jgi:hypothetical protein
MGTSLAEALHDVELESGRTYRCQVKELWIELRVLGPVEGHGVTLIPESDVQLDAWTELPASPGGSIVSTHLGPPDVPDVPDIPLESDEI